MDIKVSVIIATYNHEKYIAHTLESVVLQKTDFAFEVIVGEDCSSDNTAKIVLEYAEKYPDIIVPLIREKNMGMSGNTSDLLRHAKGEYIAMIEGDDYWIDENKLQKQVDFLDAHKDYAACFGLCQMVDENEIRLKELEVYSGFKKTGGEYTIEDFETYLLPGQTATSMYRTSGYREIPKKIKELNIDVKGLIDRHLVLFMLSIGKMYVLGEEVSAYRYVRTAGSGSWSSKNDIYSFDSIMNYLKLLKNLEIIAKKLGLPLNFDNRRKIEIRKLVANRIKFSKEEYANIRKLIISESNNKLSIIISLIGGKVVHGKTVIFRR
ncbi:glycosyltransferase family 2 protein [Butyrivibrio sp. WCD3002]|uniref:glycosyltransferase family 2 protein n=1 Tax=Butyrivibrio sp. WCD3002 TaxID=1280676 RepID=UPI000414FF3F|nr:glycosyltransferase family A protein [Butyrivibrio sp. WCD3002]